MYKFGFALVLIMMSAASVADVTRYPLPNNSTFPIAQAVEVSSGSLVFLSGVTPLPADASAAQGTPAYYGDTRTQTLSVLNRLQENLAGMELGLGDIIKLQVFLVGDPALAGNMDFSGFMAAYTEFFGTDAQPNLPARSAFQIAGLSAPLMFVEIEAIAVRAGSGTAVGEEPRRSRLRESKNLFDFLGF